MWNKFATILAILILGSVFTAEFMQWHNLLKSKREALEIHKKEKLNLLVKEVNKQLPTEIHKALHLVSLQLNSSQIHFLLETNTQNINDIPEFEPVFFEESKKLYCSELNFMQLIRNMSEISVFELRNNEKVLTQQAFTSSDCPQQNKE